MTILSENIKSGLTQALRQEVEDFRKSDAAKLLNPETFDPMASSTCFLGQAGMQNIFSAPESDSYRAKVGVLPTGLVGDRFSRMTPLEIWGAYHWSENKAMVLNLVSYLKGDNEDAPVLEFPETVLN